MSIVWNHNLDIKCRTCLNESSGSVAYYQLFDEVEENCKILDMLDSLVPEIDIKTTSQLSTLVCQICVEKLLNGYKFQQLCRETNRRLNMLYGATPFVTQPKLERLTGPLASETTFIKPEVVEYGFMISELPSDDLGEEMTLENGWYHDDGNDESGRDLSLISNELNNEGVAAVGKRGKFQCNYCPKSFEKQTSLAAHYRIHKKKDLLRSKKRLEKNLNRKNTNLNGQGLSDIANDNLGNGLFTKKKDNKAKNAIYLAKAGLSGIEKNNEKTRNFACEVCGKVFDRRGSLQRHYLVHSLDRPYECEICKYRFVEKQHYKAHFFQHKNVAEGSTSSQFQLKELNCEVCQQPFTTVQHLAKHMRNRHPDAEKHNCTKCSKTFILHECLMRHISKSHQNSKHRVCQICKKVFNSTYKFNKHLRLHDPYVCPQCGKTLCGENNLQAHMKLHTTVDDSNSNQNTTPAIKRNYTYYNPCKMCGKVFNRPSMLQRHSAVHSLDRPYNCGVCTYRFADIRSLKCHLLHHNKDEDGYAYTQSLVEGAE